MNIYQLASSLKSATKSQVAKALAKLSDEDCESLIWDWGFWARPEQLIPPGDWSTWLILSGRGWGKTRTGAETVRHWAQTGHYKRIALIGATAGDVRDVMIEGNSGILSVCPPWFLPTYEPSKRRLTFPNGVVATAFSAEEPERLRGPQFHAGWADELGAWNDSEAWDMFQFGLRLGDQPRVVVTTTPRPTNLLVELVKDPKTFTTKGHTFDNAANLASDYVKRMKHLYGNSRLGRQELAGDLLTDNPGAIFQQSWFDASRVMETPPLERIVVAIDPAPTSNEGSDPTGIHVAGRDHNKEIYLIEDCTMKGSPNDWGTEAIRIYERHKADQIVVEVNTGGDMVKSLLRTIDPSVPIKEVRALRGNSKAKRAEPVAALWEQGKIHIVGDRDRWKLFEEQAARFTGVNGRRDDRVDAALWAVHDLALSDTARLFF